jgi:hypothetical protein
MAGESASVLRDIEQRRLNHCRQLDIQRRLDPPHFAQRPKQFDCRRREPRVVIVCVDVLCNSALLNRLAIAEYIASKSERVKASRQPLYGQGVGRALWMGLETRGRTGEKAD